jgi:hypothetical protein
MANTFGIFQNAATGLSPLGQPLQYPLINGFRPSWASIEFNIAGILNYSIQSAEYKATRTRKKTRGTAVNPIAKTRGSIDYDCKVKMLLAESMQLLAQLGSVDPTGNNAYGDIFFTMTVQYAEPNSNIITDTIMGCTVDTVEQSSSEGVEDIVIEHDFAPLLILRNGQPMSSTSIGAPQF